MEGKERPTRDISPCLEFALERKLCARPTQSREGSGQAEGNSPKMSWGNPSYKEAAGLLGPKAEAGREGLVLGPKEARGQTSLAERAGLGWAEGGWCSQHSWEWVLQGPSLPHRPCLAPGQRTVEGEPPPQSKAFLDAQAPYTLAGHLGAGTHKARRPEIHPSEPLG